MGDGQGILGPEKQKTHQTTLERCQNYHRKPLRAIIGSDIQSRITVEIICKRNKRFLALFVSYVVT